MYNLISEVECNSTMLLSALLRCLYQHCYSAQMTDAINCLLHLHQCLHACMLSHNMSTCGDASRLFRSPAPTIGPQICSQFQPPSISSFNFSILPPRCKYNVKSYKFWCLRAPCHMQVLVMFTFLNPRDLVTWPSSVEIFISSIQ